MQYLQTFLGEVPLSRFLDDHFTKIPFSASGTGGNHLSLLNWDVVEQIFKENKSVLRIVREGKYFKDDARYTFEEARKHFSDGFTVLLRHAEKSHPDLQKLASEFSAFFKNVTDIQLYCTPGGHNAFGWHYDVEEVFILQTRGSKEYTIRHNTVHPDPLVSSIPKNLAFETEKSDLTMKVVLRPGDFLYIPSGWWHKAQTLEESMHISIGVMPSSATMITQALATFLAQDPFWRKRMPVHVNFASDEEAVAFYGGAFETLGKDLARKFASPDFIRHFLQSLNH